MQGKCAVASVFLGTGTVSFHAWSWLLPTASASCACFSILPDSLNFLKMCFLLKFSRDNLLLSLKYPIQWCFPWFMPSSTLLSWLYFAEQRKHQHFEFGQWLGRVIIAKLNVPHQYGPEHGWVNPMLRARCFQDLVSFVRMRGICLSCHNFHHILGPLLRVQCSNKQTKRWNKIHEGLPSG